MLSTPSETPSPSDLNVPRHTSTHRCRHPPPTQTPPRAYSFPDRLLPPTRATTMLHNRNIIHIACFLNGVLWSSSGVVQSTICTAVHGSLAPSPVALHALAESQTHGDTHSDSFLGQLTLVNILPPLAQAPTQPSIIVCAHPYILRRYTSAYRS